jgi:hypothetical protein
MKHKKTIPEEKVLNKGKWSYYREGEQNLNINFLHRVKEVFVEGGSKWKLNILCISY